MIYLRYKTISKLRKKYKNFDKIYNEIIKNSITINEIEIQEDNDEYLYSNWIGFIDSNYDYKYVLNLKIYLDLWLNNKKISCYFFGLIFHKKFKQFKKDIKKINNINKIKSQYNNNLIHCCAAILNKNLIKWLLKHTNININTQTKFNKNIRRDIFDSIYSIHRRGSYKEKSLKYFKWLLLKYLNIPIKKYYPYFDKETNLFIKKIHITRKINKKKKYFEKVHKELYYKKKVFQLENKFII